MMTGIAPAIDAGARRPARRSSPTASRSTTDFFPMFERAVRRAAGRGRADGRRAPRAVVVIARERSPRSCSATTTPSAVAPRRRATTADRRRDRDAGADCRTSTTSSAARHVRQQRGVFVPFSTRAIASRSVAAATSTAATRRATRLRGRSAHRACGSSSGSSSAPAATRRAYRDFLVRLRRRAEARRAASRARPTSALRDVTEWLDLQRGRPEGRPAPDLARVRLPPGVPDQHGRPPAHQVPAPVGEIGVRRALGASQRVDLPRSYLDRGRRGRARRRRARARPRRGSACGRSGHQPADLRRARPARLARCSPPRSRSRSPPACSPACCRPGAPARSRPRSRTRRSHGARRGNRAWSPSPTTLVSKRRRRSWCGRCR